MAISTTAEKNNLATKYGTDGAFVALFTTAPSGNTPGTEVTGGSYARVAAGWGAASAGVITGSATLNVPSGVTLLGVGLYTASTAGTYIDGVTVTSQTFASAGTYTVTLTYTQT